MNLCAGCDKEVSEEFCGDPRLPCPFCGASGRSFSCGVHESVAATDSYSASQTRPAPNGSATLDDTNRIQLNLTGRPPRNEEGSLDVSARLVRSLNVGGATWRAPVIGTEDVDAISTDSTILTKNLHMQVVRATTDEALWRTLGREGVAEKNQDATAVAQELISAVRKKAEKYPAAQRSNLTLVLDATRTPNHTFQQVHDVFARTHRAECSSFGFSSVWVVGAVDELVTRLDL